MAKFTEIFKQNYTIEKIINRHVRFNLFNNE